MCLLIASNVKVANRNWLYNGFHNNDDGAGFSYAHEGKIVVNKGFFDFEEFYKAYTEMPDCPNLVHFRLATGGMIDEANCHPFVLNENVVFGHNGVFSNVKACHDFSDTYHFNEEILKPIFGKNTEGLFTDAANELLGSFIGKGNKLAFLKSSGEITIVNHSAGRMEGESWFSNSSYTYEKKKYTPYQGQNRQSAPLPPINVVTGTNPPVKLWLGHLFDRFSMQEFQ